MLREVGASFPALIPEVWLNTIGYDRTADDEAHLRENPQRVDFVMFVDGEKYVIEIDGPSHYADFDEERRTWSINQERYTKNLRIERSLRRHGWEIFRFSNLEVEQTEHHVAFGNLISHLPGCTPRLVSDTEVEQRVYEFASPDFDIPEADFSTPTPTSRSDALRQVPPPGGTLAYTTALTP